MLFRSLLSKRRSSASALSLPANSAVDGRYKITKITENRNIESQLVIESGRYSKLMQSTPVANV